MPEGLLPSLPGRLKDERGSAVVDFVLVSVVLVPLFLAILQLAVVWHIRSTLTASASQGARYGAAYDRSTEDGEQRTLTLIEESLSADLVESIEARLLEGPGMAGMVEVEVVADVPILAFWGPAITVEVKGHAIKETLP
jgi:hypothetical protein